LEKVNKIIAGIKEYAVILGFTGSSLAGGIAYVHNYVIMPIVDEHIEKVSGEVMREWIDDSARIYINQEITSKGTGFRGELEQVTHISRHRLADTLGNLIKQVPSYRFYYNYQRGFNEFLFRSVCVRKDTLGTTLWRHPKGYYLFRDSLGFVWDAPIIAGKAYFYPPYQNNKRQECYEID